MSSGPGATFSGAWRQMRSAMKLLTIIGGTAVARNTHPAQQLASHGGRARGTSTQRGDGEARSMDGAGAGGMHQPRGSRATVGSHVRARRCMQAPSHLAYGAVHLRLRHGSATRSRECTSHDGMLARDVVEGCTLHKSWRLDRTCCLVRGWPVATPLFGSY